MVHVINTFGTIDKETEMHHAVLTNINQRNYPQVHDFYEIVLIIEGEMVMEINQTSFTLEPDMLCLIRPKDIHSKFIRCSCKHVNLAFPQKTVHDLFSYLKLDITINTFLSKEVIAPVQLSQLHSFQLQNKFASLHLVPFHDRSLIKSHLRYILMDILPTYFIFGAHESLSFQSLQPDWLRRYLEKITSKDFLSQPNHTIIEASHKTHEHLCRIFKKYLHTTPTTYINNLRLTYAANLLIHSDQTIMDIALTVGFQSLSYFYKIFAQKYTISPAKFRKKNYIAMVH